MIFVGDYFALGLVIILSLFFFDSKAGLRYMSSASRLFIGCLMMTALTALTDLISLQLLAVKTTPLWQNMLCNTLYFVVNIATTTCIALYLFTKLLEHTHERHCMRRACTGLALLFVGYMFVVVGNLWTGWLFYFDEAGNYCRGPLNVLGYVITMMQLALVGVCYFRNWQYATRPMRRVLMQFFPVIPLCIVIARTYPEIMLNAFLMALVDTVLFLSFQGQRQGVHSLTELNDRHRFFEEVDARIKKQEPFQIFLINIQHFGAINQKFGHLFGDEFLYQFAFALEKLLKGSLSFHMNGTVFAMVLRYTYPNEAERLSGALLEFMEQGICCMDQHVTADYVVVHYVADGTEKSAAELYENMEYAGEKSIGQKQKYIRCTGEIREETIRRRYLKERLQEIDKLHGYEVWFQPIKCLETGKFYSMEALIRLKENDGTFISPAEFIPLAEQTGQVSMVTWFVLEEVCKLLKFAPKLEGVSVSINLPMAQLLEKGFVPKFTSIVNQAGIDHHRICIEFTERAILDNFRQTQSVMEKLNQEGFRFYLDDFGTGYSNFNCLLQLPFQIIKLDTCIVHTQRGGVPDYTMVRMLTNLLHDMGLIAVAEGAETQEEVRALTELGVDRIQGFALARPMPVDALMRFYQENPVIDAKE